MNQQFSLFGAAAAEPSIADVDGVLLAGGQWVRGAGTARLSVLVADRWRADALAQEFEQRELSGPDAIVASNGGWSVRTAFTAGLSEQATRWLRGAREGPPESLNLTPGGLRLWAIAAGRLDGPGYLLGTARADAAVHLAAGAQLSRMGLAAVAIGGRGTAGWRITSTKRLRRLAELVGAAPHSAGPDWPGTS
jgi:hypothetical protein